MLRLEKFVFFHLFEHFWIRIEILERCKLVVITFLMSIPSKTKTKHLPVVCNWVGGTPKYMVSPIFS